MPWLRTGDTAANHPIALAVLEDPSADDRLLNEVFGFVSRCALQSTAHLTDYIISRGTAIAMAGISRVDALLAAAMGAGYLTLTEIVVEGVARPAYKLLDDPDFIHMRTREEIEWERQRKTDNSNPALIVPVRLRDGDACRYCGLVVDFRPGQRKGRIAGTYDHREPGKQATIETYVVACRACNAARGNDPMADKALPLQPEPSKPYFSAHTIEWIRTNEWASRNGIRPPKKSVAIAPGKPARVGKGGATPANGSSSGPAPEVNGSSVRTSTGEASDNAKSGNGSSTGQTPEPGNGSTGTVAHVAHSKSISSHHGVGKPPESLPKFDANPADNPGLTWGNPGSGRNPQIPQNARLQDLDLPGRDGSGRVGSVLAGTGRDGSGAAAPLLHGPASKQTTQVGRSRPRSRKGKRT